MARKGQAMDRTKSAMIRRHELMEQRRLRSRSSTSFAEIAGGTTAGVAAIACCAPYGVAEILTLAIYKPAGMCRKAIKERRRQRLIKSGALSSRSLSIDSDFGIEAFSLSEKEKESEELNPISENEIVELEKEMWEKFSGAGFWRTPEEA